MNVELVTVYLGIGSNMGNRKENIEKAMAYLSQKLRITEKSSVYDTEPVGNQEQPRFLNMVCQVKTMLKAVDLLVLAKAIECKLGRMPGKKNSPRPMDIDILFYGDEVINTPDLRIPHPRLIHRAFVLVPLAELAPNLVHPVNKQSVRELLNNLKHGVQGILKLE